MDFILEAIKVTGFILWMSLMAVFIRELFINLRKLIHLILYRSK
jgi:hypothetical protein